MTRLELDDEDDIGFWLHESHPLKALAITILSIVPHTADVERLFSNYVVPSQSNVAISPSTPSKHLGNAAPTMHTTSTNEHVQLGSQFIVVMHTCTPVQIREFTSILLTSLKPHLHGFRRLQLKPNIRMIISPRSRRSGINRSRGN
jgi:hypothetical protein